MGTVIFVIRAEILIRKSDAEAVFKAVKSLVPPKSPVRHLPDRFAFVDSAEVAAAENLYELLSAWRWLVIEDDNGDICDLEFTGEKSGNEDTLFEAIAPFVRSGGQIVFATDQGDILRWFFNHGKVYVQKGKVVFEQL